MLGKLEDYKTCNYSDLTTSPIDEFEPSSFIEI